VIETEKPHERTCSSCERKWVGRESTCPYCGNLAKSGGDEVTKKVVDDNDLKNGG
jgi:ribosomal protein L37AE/L43A